MDGNDKLGGHGRKERNAENMANYIDAKCDELAQKCLDQKIAVVEHLKKMNKKQLRDYFFPCQ